MADTIVTPDVEANAGNIELKDNTIIVVLGASGDLAKKKTVRFPAPSTLSRARTDEFE
jgi:glucose-6-phosphate 1-dehydrogenase